MYNPKQDPDPVPKKTFRIHKTDWNKTSWAVSTKT